MLKIKVLSNVRQLGKEFYLSVKLTAILLYITAERKCFDNIYSVEYLCIVKISKLLKISNNKEFFLGKG